MVERKIEYEMRDESGAMVPIPSAIKTDAWYTIGERGVMIDSKTERVARAIARTFIKGDPDYDFGGHTLDQEVNLGWRNWTDEARSAIEAMPDPPEEEIDFSKAQPD